MGGGLEDMPPMDAPMTPPSPMPNDPMMGGEEMPMDAPQDQDMGGENDELMSVIDSLSTEDKAAVLKYAKSMSEDNEPKGNESQEDDMPPIGESKVMETLRPSVNGNEDRKRENNKLPKRLNGKKNPFISPY